MKKPRIPSHWQGAVAALAFLAIMALVALIESMGGLL
jgi:hypothetical protein